MPAPPYETGFEFPLTLYDRPSLALANLLGGSFTPTVEALFNPEGLSPSELKTIRHRFLKGKAAQNPLIKAAVDIASNPLFIMGVLLAVSPWGKIIKPKQYHQLLIEGQEAIKPIGALMKWVSSPFIAYRNVPKFVTRMIDHLRDQSQFTRGMVDDINRALTKLGTITDKEAQLVGMFQEGWHKSSKMIAAAVPGARAKELKKAWNPVLRRYTHHFGADTKNITLAPGLIPALKSRTGLYEFATEMQRINVKYGKRIFFPSDEVGRKIMKSMADKGIEYRPENYFHRRIITHHLEGWAPAAANILSVKKQRAILNAIGRRGYMPGPLRIQTGSSVPLMSELENVKEVLGPGILDKFVALERSDISGLYRDITAMLDQVRNLGSPVGLPKQAALVHQQKVGHWSIQLQEVLRKALIGSETKGMAGRNTEAIIRNMSDDIISLAYQPKEEVEAFLSGMSRLIGAPSKYSFHATKAARSYATAMGPTYAWFSKGHGKAMIGYLDEAAKSGNALRWQQTEFVDDLAPLLQGSLHPKEWARINAFKNWKRNINLWITTDPTAQRLLPKSTKEWLAHAFSDARGSISEASLGGGVSHLFHLSTLGGNIGATSKNALQPAITTAEWLGLGNMVKGGKVVMNRVPKYLALGKKVGWETAFKRTFPEYYKMVGHENIGEALRLGDISKEGKILAVRAKGISGKAQQALMAPFAGVEKWNRLWSFYAGQEAALYDGLAKGAAAEFGFHVMHHTQFPGGVLGMPMKLQGVSPPLRQFMHFPMRFAEFLGSSIRMGPDPSKVSVGILGRGLAGSTGMYYIAKNLLKTDISQGLAFQALPVPAYEGTPFFPFPMVPPAVGVVGNIATALFKGDASRLPGTAALLIPGGLATRRAYRALAPKYADYDNRAPDGTIPVYNEKGSLISNQTPMMLTMRALGLHHVGVAGEREFTKYLLSQREKIRKFRREYVQSLSSNNLEKAQKISMDFQRKYPELGPLVLKKSDIRAERNRRQISRVNRILKGFPKEYKPLFQELINYASLNQITQDLQFNPENLQSYLGPQ